MFPLKPISAAGVAAALDKAERYRLLNDPEAAESICLDVLELEPENQRALVALLLARTDQFGTALGRGEAKAREVLPRLEDGYARAYYGGLIAERRGMALLHSNAPGSGLMAYHCLREAMEWYEKAEALRPPANDDSLLRWNTCVRILQAHPHLQPKAEEQYVPLLED